MNEINQIWTDLRILHEAIQSAYMLKDQDALRVLAERAERVYYDINTSEDNSIAHSQSEVYIAGNELFLCAIRMAYPNVDEDAVLDIWRDCNEPISYCVNVAKRHKQDNTDSMMEMWSARYIPE